MTLEVTETVLMEDGDRALLVMRELRSLGVSIALDDFGTGYSSLSYLRRLPVDIVKIDRGFVAELGDPTTSAIVSTVVGLAHILGMTVVAEGVETAAQYDEVAAFGCEESQGYFFARPMSSELAQRPLARGTWRRHLAAPGASRRMTGSPKSNTMKGGA